MKSSPQSEIVRLCIQAMGLARDGDTESARATLRRAWDEATDDHERVLVPQQHEDEPTWGSVEPPYLCIA